MSAPIAHLLISQEAYAPFFAKRNKEHIYIGTSFPDIRHLVGAKREITHYAPQFLLDSEDFLLGIDLHNWMDEARSAYVTFMLDESYREKAPLLFDRDRFGDLTSKFFEDEVALEKINDLNAMKIAIGNTCESEGGFGFGEDYLNQWHNIVLSYLSDAANGDELAYKNMIISDREEVLKKAQPYMQEYRSNPVYREYLEGMFDYLLKSFRIEMGRRLAVTD